MVKLSEVFTIGESDEFSDEEIADLSYLIHDKGHVGGHAATVPALEKALRTRGETCRVPLYRGLPKDLGTQGRFSLDGYSSFTERQDVAVRFARSYGSDIVLRLEDGSGFNYHSWLEDLLEKQRMDDPKGYDAADGDFMLKSVREESEWILPRNSRFTVTGREERGEITVVTVQQGSR